MPTSSTLARLSLPTKNLHRSSFILEHVMSMTMADEIKLWPAKHKAALAKSYDLQ